MTNVWGWVGKQTKRGRLMEKCSRGRMKEPLRGRGRGKTRLVGCGEGSVHLDCTFVLNIREGTVLTCYQCSHRGRGQRYG